MPGFPLDRYTPHGYLDNPRHAWRVGRTGVVRSIEGIGFAWHVPSYPGPYGRRWVYQAELQINLGRSAPHVEHHTTRLFRYRTDGATVELFLDEETLVARVEAAPGTKVAARATYRRQLGQSGDWDFGLLARQDADGAGHLAVYAEGTAFVLKADQPPGAVELPPPDAAWPDRAGPVEKTILHGYLVPAGGRLTVVLARAESSLAAGRAATAALARAEATRQARLDADEAFWRGAPRLGGDWPAHWRRGFVYDIETLRAIVRPPAGVYRSRWDGMQLQVPRVVLAETALDMLLLSYADPDTAREVILGTLRDAIAPNVPCTREDGSVNMVAVDGSACGTSPAWCWPFWCIGLLYRRTADRAWLAELVPHLEAYLDWWLAHRVGPDGQPFYLCGWESGQDASPRFNAAERGGGGIEGVRPIDLCAAIAQSARLLAVWIDELAADPLSGFGREPSVVDGQPSTREPSGRVARWRAVADDYTRRARAMWHPARSGPQASAPSPQPVVPIRQPSTVDRQPVPNPRPAPGWFHDWTADGPTAVRDPMQLAPLMCGLATAEHAAALRAHLRDLPGHGEYSPLEWPPVALTVLESALWVGERDWAAETAAGLLERVWSATDAPIHQPGRPLPGIAHEHWPPEGAAAEPGVGWHTEGYGWGATTVLLFLRYVAGVRDEPESDQLAIEPVLPLALRVPGRRYQVLNLPWRGERVDLTYSVGADGAVVVEKSWSRRSSESR